MLSAQLLQEPCSMHAPSLTPIRYTQQLFWDDNGRLELKQARKGTEQTSDQTHLTRPKIKCPPQ
jgi:hypothetical protein